MYKKHKVIMLPTTDTPNSKVCVALTRDNDEYFIPENNNQLEGSFRNNKLFHLYILSDEKIEVGYYIYNEDYGIDETKTIESGANAHVITTRGYHWHIIGSKKIIATTDTTLNLPLISKEFVENYCKNQVKEVMVEYYPEVPLDNESKINIEESIVLIDNKYISLKPTKDSWSKEEVRELLYKLTNNYVESTNPIQLGRWIEEQLK